MGGVVLPIDFIGFLYIKGDRVETQQHKAGTIEGDKRQTKSNIFCNTATTVWIFQLLKRYNENSYGSIIIKIVMIIEVHVVQL